MERRTFLLASGCALLGATDWIKTAIAAPAPAPAPAQKATAIVSEQLLHTVVRIECPVPGGTIAGTGFFYGFFDDGKTENLCIVSNKHVLLGHSVCRIVFTAQGTDGQPDLTKLIPVTITDLAASVIPHPDQSVDLAIVNISGIVNELQKRGTPVYFSYCNDGTIPDAATRASLTPLEDILTVGFPGTVWDTTHNLPIFHRGITATPINVDFQGRKEFLIDSAVWAGASGSPVFLYEQGALFDIRRNNTSFGWRLMLLGIVYANVLQDVSGDIHVQQIPTVPHVDSGVPSNLGICISSQRILDFQPVLMAKGIKPPSDFKMRAMD